MKLKSVSYLAFASALTLGQGVVAHDQFQHIRNATIKLNYADVTFLIDPMLAAKGTYPGLPGTYRSHIRNPMVDLPVPVAAVIDDVDAVIVTHTHPDHWDQVAQNSIPKTIPIFAQDQADAELIRSQGFLKVDVLTDTLSFKGVTLTRTNGHHGDETLLGMEGISRILGKIMGVILKAPGHQTVYFAGDTVWCDEVESALRTHRPDITVVNAGAAILEGLDEHPILMGKEDVVRVAQTAPFTRIIAVHMEAINHCSLTRQALEQYIKTFDLEERVMIPEDGETLHLSTDVSTQSE
ncbi:MBL fold metallo-hydrolase [Marinobacter salarius]|uniref:MBL fold metallo-hydrolase n=1 Tax=Marinobacter salarius TaxID=1420917 RepID=UPI003D9C56B3